MLALLLLFILWKYLCLRDWSNDFCDCCVQCYSCSCPGHGLCISSSSHFFSLDRSKFCCVVFVVVFLLSIGHHRFIIMLVINYFCFHLEREWWLRLRADRRSVYIIADHFLGVRVHVSCALVCVCVRMKHFAFVERHTHRVHVSVVTKRSCFQ